MKRYLFIIVATFLFSGVAGAATIQDDHIFACDKNLNVTPALQPVALLNVTAADIDAKHFDLAYKRIAQIFEASILDTERKDPQVTSFISRIRGAQGRGYKDFDVRHNPDNRWEVFFQGPKTEIIYECDQLPPYFADMASVSLMTQWVRGQETIPELEKRAHNVVNQSKAHEALLYNGLPMWPWELWLNGKRLGKNDSDPLFKTQWILMRPTAGLEINTRNQASGNLDASVGVEPLGFIHYQNDEYKSWWGASLLVTSSTNAGIGLGGLLRWNNYVLGLARHESNSAGTPASNFLFVGIELYDFANKKRGDFEAWKTLQKTQVAEVLK
jgi:hypothetical protein